MKKLLYLLILISCLFPSALHAWVNWRNISTEKFTVYYQPGCEDDAWQAIAVLEYYRPFTENLVGNSYPKAAVKLEDMGNLINGWANPVGSTIALFLYPPTSDELGFGEEWFQLVAPHEYIHQLQLTHDSDTPELVRKALGNIFHVQLHQPPWMTEGITVYGESRLSPYSGRMNSGYYSALISTLAKADKLPSPTKAAYYSTDTPLAHYYVFGGSFHQYLAKTYGEDRFKNLYIDNSSRVLAYLNGILPTLALNKAFENTYGKPLESLWQDWQDFEAKKDFTPASENITQDGWNKSNLQLHNQKVYFNFSKMDKTSPGGGFTMNGIACLDPTKPNLSAQVIHTQSTEYPAGYQISKDKLYFTRTETKRGYKNNDNDGYGYFTQLLVKDINSGAAKLIYSGNIRAFYCTEDGSTLIAEDDPNYRSSSLFRYFPATKQKELLYHGDFLIHGIAQNMGKTYLNAKGYWQNSSIYTLTNGALLPLIDSPTKETLLYIAEDKLYYNAIVEDRTCAFEYNLNTGQNRQFFPVSYVQNPVITPAGDTYFISISPQGQDIFKDSLTLVEADMPSGEKSLAPFAYAEYKERGAILDKYPVKQGGYSQNLLHLINPRMAHIPQFYVNGDSLAVGAVLVGSDAVGDFPMWQLWGLYDTHYEQFRVDFSLSNSFFRPLLQEFRYSNLDGNSLSSVQYLSLFRSVNYGFNSLNAGFGYSTKDDFNRKILNPFVSSGFAWQGGRIGWYNSIFYEDIDTMKSSRNRLGWQSQVSFRHKTGFDSEINSTLNLGIDPDADPDEVFYPIRGYDNELSRGEGFTLRNTWQKSLYKIRKGYWSPQVYLEDVFMALFADAAVPREFATDDFQISAGLELSAEVNLLFVGAINPGIRLGVNRDSKLFMGILLGLDF